jgi:hypothetical protein
VDESYLGKKCARKTDTEDFNNAVDEIHKQEKSFFLWVCVRARAHLERIQFIVAGYNNQFYLICISTTKNVFVRYEVLMAVTTKITVVRDVTPCGLVERS